MPSNYRDEYREELLALIERKAKGEQVSGPSSEAPTPTKAPDLMAALEESLAAVTRRGGEVEVDVEAGEVAQVPSAKSKSGSSRSRSKAKAAK